MNTTTNYGLSKPDVGSVGWGDEVNTNFDVIDTHIKSNADSKVPITRTVNGHSLSADVTVSKSDVGLGNVDNTSDANKPVSTAQQTALNLRVLNDGTVNPTNLLSNGNFESWSAGTLSAPDGWTLVGTGAVITKTSNPTYVKVGTYSCALERGSEDSYLTQDVAPTKGITYFKGRAITFGCWVWSAVANRARLFLSAGNTGYSSYHTGSSSWEWLTVTITVGNSATSIQCLTIVDTGSASCVFDGAMCVEGSSSFAFSPKPAEEGVWADYSAVSTIMGWASFTTKKIMTKLIGKRCIVEGYISGVSNSPYVQISLPYNPSQLIGVSVYLPCAITSDNGGDSETSVGYVIYNNPVLIINKGQSGNFTNSGTKIVQFQLSYEVA